MLDFAPLHTWHFYLFLGIFIVAFLLLANHARQVRFRQGSASIPKAGFFLLATITVASLFIIEGTWERIGFGIAAILIALVGKSDEVQPLSPWTQLIWQLIIASIVVIFGWTIPYVSNPISGGILPLNQLMSGSIILPGSLLAVAWILLLINAINWLDGLDGLAGGVVLIAQLALIGISLLPQTQDADTLVLAIIAAAALAAFLIWNFPPARVYLGTVGSWFIGLFTALVAIQGGGKIVTTALVLALPVLDMFFVIAHRIMSGKLPWKGDTISHLHHRLLASGLNARQITVAAIIVTIALAAASILLPTPAKLAILAIAALGFIFVFVKTVSHPLKQTPHQ